MKMRPGLLATTIAMLAFASPSLAQDVQSPRDATPCATPACERNERETSTESTEEGRTLAAEVVSIDRSGGRVLLETELGMVAVPATPAIIAQLNVGDIVMLRVLGEADDAPAASPPTEDDSTEDQPTQSTPGSQRL